MISESLDQLAFGTTSTRPKNDFLQKCLVIDQQNCFSPANANRLIRSQATLGAVAVVDRTGDLAAAAKAIATSTVLFAGQGPYAPTCIFVNEFSEKEFSRLFEQYASDACKAFRSVSENGHADTSEHKQKGMNGRLSRYPMASRNAALIRLTNW